MCEYMWYNKTHNPTHTTRTLIINKMDSIFFYLKLRTDDDDNMYLAKTTSRDYQPPFKLMN